MRCALYVGDGSEGRCRLDCTECAPWCGRVVGSGIPVPCRYGCDRLAPRLLLPRGGVLAVRHMLGKLVVGLQVYVSVAQAIPVRFLFDEMQDDLLWEAL